MRCSKAKRFIELNLDGLLAESQAKALNEHLSSCSACWNWQAEAEKLHLLLSNAPQSEFPAWIHAQIMDKVHRLENRRPGFIRRFKLAPATAMLAIVFSFWLGTNVGIRSFGTPSSPATKAASSITTASLSDFGENSLLGIWDEAGDLNE